MITATSTSSYDLPETWGASEQPLGERIRLGFDAEDVSDPQVCIDYLPNGRTAIGTVTLSAEETSGFALAFLRLASSARGCTTIELLTELLTTELRR